MASARASNGRIELTPKPITDGRTSSLDPFSLPEAHLQRQITAIDKGPSPRYCAPVCSHASYILRFTVASNNTLEQLATMRVSIFAAIAAFGPTVLAQSLLSQIPQCAVSAS